MTKSPDVFNRPFEEPIPVIGDKKYKAMPSDEYSVVVVMKGRGISPGRAIGRTTVVVNREDVARVERGEVIIAKGASPDLVAGISKACAVATEYGGQGAIVSEYARKYGIPAVVGVAGLIEAVKDGDLVRVDGTEGCMEILRARCRKR